MSIRSENRRTYVACKTYFQLIIVLLTDRGFPYQSDVLIQYAPFYKRMPSENPHAFPAG